MSADFGREIVARKILDEPLVFYRTEAGEPIALWGLCPHRLMPFELGKLEGDRVVCGYHGFQFDNSGACVKIPTTSTIPSKCRIKSYPLVERGPFVWIWMGEGVADHDLIPDASDIGIGIDATVPGWRVDPLPLVPLAARAQFLIDNLLDLSHLYFVHAMSTDGADVALEEAVVKDDGKRIFVKRVLRDAPADGFVAYLFPEAGPKVWVELTAVVYNPGLINTSGPWCWRSNPDGSQGELVGKMNFTHAVTPETRFSTHYFGAQTRDFRLDDDELSAVLVHQNEVVRGEDRVVLERIEQVAEQYADPRREISILPDAGALRVRRRLADLIAHEQQIPIAAE